MTRLRCRATLLSDEELSAGVEEFCRLGSMHGLVAQAKDGPKPGTVMYVTIGYQSFDEVPLHVRFAYPMYKRAGQVWIVLDCIGQKGDGQEAWGIRFNMEQYLREHPR